MNDNNILNNKWTILKYFQKYLNKNLSIVERHFLVNPLWLLKKLKYLHDDKDARVSFPSEMIRYIEEVISSDKIITKNEKELANDFISTINGKKVDWNSEQLDLCLETMDFKSKNSYFNRIDKKLKATLKKIINGTEDPNEELEEYIKIYISTRIDLGFSIESMSLHLKREVDAIKSVEQKNIFLDKFFLQFRTKAVTIKKLFSIFIPINVQGVPIKLLRNIKSDHFKIVRYSYPEWLMPRPKNVLTKNFDKDILYLAIENKESFDSFTFAQKTIWEEASFIAPIFKLNNINFELNFDNPSILITHDNRPSKDNWMDEIWPYNQLNESSAFNPITQSVKLIDQLKNGDFKDNSPKFKSFLNAKNDFNIEVNPIQRISAAAKELELFLKYPFKKGYGATKNRFDSICNLSHNVHSNLLSAHRIHLVRRNLKSLCNSFDFNDEKKNIEIETNPSKKTTIFLEILKKIDNSKIMISNPWINSVVDKIKKFKFLPKKEVFKFKNFLSLSAILTTAERNRQAHNKGKYVLKDIMLSESVDAMLSVASRIQSRDKNKQ